MKMKLYYGALALLWLLSSCTPSSNVTDNYDKVGTCRNGHIKALILNEFLPEVPDDKVLALGLVEVCTLQGCEDGPKIPKSKMGIIIKELKAMFPAADGKQIADLVKSCVV